MLTTPRISPAWSRSTSGYGAWLLVNWPEANQWVFIKGKQVRAVANIRQQFARGDGLGPLLELSGRWCCAK